MTYDEFMERIDKVDLDYGFYERFIEHHGGCNCSYLGSIGAAPCSACTDETTYQEFVELGLIIKPDGTVIDLEEEWPTESVQEFKSASDIMDATRAMCGKKYR